MDRKKRRYYPYKLKKEIIQKVKDGIKRSDIQKEYGISPSSLSRWICPPEKIIVRNESVRHHPIQHTPEGDRDGEVEVYGDGYGDGDGDGEVDGDGDGEGEGDGDGDGEIEVYGDGEGDGDGDGDGD